MNKQAKPSDEWSERDIALWNEKQRIEYEYASEVMDIDESLPQPAVAMYTALALTQLDDETRKDMEAEKDAAFSRILKEYDSITDTTALVDDESLDTSVVE